MLNALVTAVAPCGALTDRNCLTRSPVDLALALFRTSCWWVVHAAVDEPEGSPPHAQPLADTRRASTVAPCGAPADSSDLACPRASQRYC